MRPYAVSVDTWNLSLRLSDFTLCMAPIFMNYAREYSVPVRITRLESKRGKWLALGTQDSRMVGSKVWTQKNVSYPAGPTKSILLSISHRILEIE